MCWSISLLIAAALWLPARCWAQLQPHTDERQSDRPPPPPSSVLTTAKPAAGPSELAESFTAVLQVLGWGEDAPPTLARGTPRTQPHYFGDLFRAAPPRRRARPLTRGQRLRSPVFSADGQHIFVLSEEAMVKLDKSGQPVHTLRSFPAATIQRLLLHSPPILWALGLDGCLLAIDLTSGEVRQRSRPLSRVEQEDLLARGCSCHKPGEQMLSVAERRVGRPIWRIDVLLQQGHSSRNVTRDAPELLNANPALSKDCHQLVYISARHLHPYSSQQ